MTLGDFVLLLNSLIWAMGLGIYGFSYLWLQRKGRTALGWFRSSSGFFVVLYLVYGYIEAFTGNAQLEPRHFVGIVVGLFFLLSSAFALGKQLEQNSQTSGGH